MKDLKLPEEEEPPEDAVKRTVGTCKTCYPFTCNSFKHPNPVASYPEMYVNMSSWENDFDDNFPSPLIQGGGDGYDATPYVKEFIRIVIKHLSGKSG